MKRIRGRDGETVERAEDGDFWVSYAQYLDAKYPQDRGKESRLCLINIQLMKAHLHSIERCCKGKCVVYG